MKAEQVLIQIIEAATGKTADELLQGLFEDPQLPSVNFNDMPVEKSLAMHEDLGWYAHEQGLRPMRVGVVVDDTELEAAPFAVKLENLLYDLLDPEKAVVMGGQPYKRKAYAGFIARHMLAVFAKFLEEQRGGS